ncbi:hypothetical protein [Ancylobacter terrae]|uniref:hypothetical protein n=1 Tax=Ancylobacter sp. sgz301288 TaxID=3342077 RepID=UPI003859F033
MHATATISPERNATPDEALARAAVFGAPAAGWVFVEVDTLAWQQWRDFCRARIGRSPIAARILTSRPDGHLGWRLGRSLPSARPPGAPILDRKRIAAGERDEETLA